MKIEFTIPIEPRTKKNSQRIIRVRTQSGLAYSKIIPSKAYLKYHKDCAALIPRLYEPLDREVNVRAVYYMATHRKVDLVNLHEALLDILVDYGVLSDDNSNIVASMDGSTVLYDKESPRTEVEITLIEKDLQKGR